MVLEHGAGYSAGWLLAHWTDVEEQRRRIISNAFAGQSLRPAKGLLVDIRREGKVYETERGLIVLNSFYCLRVLTFY
jgi:hypothetical protein